MGFEKGHIPWNLGLTKEENLSLKHVSERMKESNPAKREDVQKKISASRKGKPGNRTGTKQSNETKQKISNSVKNHVKQNGAYWEGKTLTEEHCLNLSLSHRGKTSGRKGKTLSEEQKREISTATKLAMNTPEVKEKMKEARKNQIFPFKDTGIEKQVFAMLDGYLIDYSKHGWIERLLLHTPYKYHRFDIVIDGIKTIIEVQGCYWHGCNSCFPNPSPRQLKQIRKDKEIKQIAESNGWTIVYIWEHDLKNKKDADINAAHNIALRCRDDWLKGRMNMEKTHASC